MTFLASHVTWTFSTEVSDDELLSSFLNKGQSFAVDEIQRSLAEERVAIPIAALCGATWTEGAGALEASLPSVGGSVLQI